MLRGFPLLLRPPVSAPERWRICKSKMSGMPKPICLKFISLEDGEFTTKNTSSGFKFRLVSYNILAQVYVKSSYFPHTPSSCLKWKARSQAILMELKNLSADFLCIQELDEYNSFYKSNMENLGYSSIYIQRTGQKKDGCGILYRPSSAELVLKEEIHYNDLVNGIDYGNVSTEIESNGMLDIDRKEEASGKDSMKENSHGDHGDPSDPRVRLKRDCVGLLAAFKLRDASNHLIIVANTHIYWDPDWADVKLAQVKYLLTRVSQFKEVVSNKFCSIPSVIVAGDFNSTPGDEVYKYLLGANSDSEAPAIQLCSLYATNGGEPPFTNCTPDFTGTLDYIFLSDAGYLKPVSLLEVPGPESADIIGGLPNHYHPSDHLPIGADFVVLGSSNSSIVPKLHDVEDGLVKFKIEEDKKDQNN
ncbi:carbon catabolite repressor protein 4 homolog 4 isoform X2 [Phoenix dactylifera]|uniref:Carbon catabolite repressor protein 4 homolog 4 isoform X2 n=1 Tax=Phoenix dactylifera TaxID=42345 RepID=A0A8B7CFR8_PHODC|nr:carbon catabolite repressor protein 4 homolog 4 isoform X2 [Phoenix dactylifera]